MGTLCPCGPTIQAPARRQQAEPTVLAQPLCCPAITLGRWGTAAATVGAATALTATHQQSDGAEGSDTAAAWVTAPAVSPWAPASPEPTQTPCHPSTTDRDCVTSVTNTGPLCTRASPVSDTLTDRLTWAPAMASSPQTAKTHFAFQISKGHRKQGAKSNCICVKIKPFSRWNFLFNVGACELGS